MSGSSPPKKRVRTEEVQDGTNLRDFRVKEVYVAVHCENDSYNENHIKVLGVYESIEEAEREIVGDKISEIIISGDVDELEQKYMKEFSDDSDSYSEAKPWSERFDEEAIERDLDELVKKYFKPGVLDVTNHTWVIQKKKIVYADSDFVAGFVKSAHKT
jgi:hypothetical protein